MNHQIKYNILFDTDTSKLQQVKTELQQLSNLTVRDLKLFDPSATKASLQEVKTAAETMGTALQNSFNPKLNTTSISKFNVEIQKSGMSIKQLEAGFLQAGSKGASAFRNITTQLFTTQKAVRQTSPLLQSLTTTFFNTLKWSIASSAISGFTGAVRNAWNYTKKLDTSLNNIRIVTGQSQEEMEKFASSANKAAKALGTATTEYTDAALIYYQQGLDEKDVLARANVTIKAANVTGQSAKEVSEQLTAVWNGYRVASDEAELYVDKLAKVAATTASNLEELSEGMSKVASSANAMGVNIDQLTASLSTVISATRQDASSVGTAFKTIFARMGDLQVDGVDEFGTKLGDVSGKLKQMGVDVLNQEGNLRNMGEVIEEVASKWGTWTDAQQQAAAVALAGKRQYNNLIALFENWDKYEEAKSTSSTSAGTLEKQQEIYLDSLAGKLEQLGAAGEKIMGATFDSDSMKDMIDGVTKLADGFGTFLEGIGGGGNALLMLGSILVNVFQNQLGNGLLRIIGNINVLKQNAQEYAAQILLQNQYQNVQEEGVKKIVQLNEIKLKNAKLLTAEERKQIDNLMEATAQVYKQQDALKQNVAEAKKYAESTLLPVGVSIQGTGGSSQGIKRANDGSIIGGKVSQEVAADMIERRANEFQESYQKQSLSGATRTLAQEGMIKTKDGNTLSDLDSTQLNAEKLNAEKQGNEQLAESIQKVIDAKNTLQNANQNLQGSIDNAIKSGRLDAEQSERLIQIKKQLENGTISEATADRELAKVIDQVVKKEKKYAETLKNAKNETERLKNELKNLDAQGRKTKIDAANKNIASGAMQMASAATSIVSSISMISNAFKTLKDPDMDPGEKVLQVASAFLMAGTMIISGGASIKQGISKIGEGLKAKHAATMLQMEEEVAAKVSTDALKTASDNAQTQAEINNSNKKSAMGKKEIAEDTAQTGAKVVNDGVQTASEKVKGKAIESTGNKAAVAWLKILGPALIFVAVLGTIIAIIAIAKKAADKAADDGKKNFDAANKTAQETADAFNTIKSAYDDLKESIEDYHDSKNALDQLRKGTTEWKEALNEVNSQVINLMQRYPELAQYVSNVGGELVISQAGLDAIEEKQKQKVQIAQNAVYSANIARLQAENDMISQQASTKYLSNAEYKTNSFAVYQRDARGSIKKDANGNPIISHTVYAQNQEEFERYQKMVDAGEAQQNTQTYTVAERDRDKAMKTALDVINRRGKDILLSRDSFANAMKANGLDSESLIDALYEQKTALIENSNRILMNSKQTELLRLQTAKNILEGNTEYDKLKEEEKDVVASITAQAGTDKNNKVYKDAIASLDGDDSGNDPDNDKVKSEYTKLMGYEGATSSIKDGKIIYEFADGRENVEVSIEAAKQTIGSQAAMKVAKEAALKNVANITKAYNLNKAKGLDSFYSGQVGDLSDLTSAELQKLEAGSGDLNQLAKYLGFSNVDELEKHAKDLGYIDAKTFMESVQGGIGNYKWNLLDLRNNLFPAVKEAFSGTDGIDLTNFTLGMQKSIGNSLAKAYEEGGQKGLNALKQFLKNNKLSSDELDAFLVEFNNIDWSDFNAINKFKVALDEAGISTLHLGNDWEELLKTMESRQSAIYSIINGLHDLENASLAVKEALDGISIGKIIDEEKYKAAITANADLAKNFIRTIGGYMYVGGENATENLNKAMNNYLDPKKIISEAANIKDIGLQYLGTEEQKKELFKATGNNLELYKDNKDIKSTNSNIEGFETLTYEQIANAKNIEELLGLINISGNKVTEEWQRKASAAMTAAVNKIAEAEAYVVKADKDIEALLTKIEDGTYDEEIRKEILMSLSSAGNYNNLKELEKYRDFVGQEDFDNLAKGFLAQEAEQFKINTSLWEKYAKGQGLQTQDEFLDKMYELQLYNEGDAYAKLTDEINKNEKALSRLETEQDKYITGSKSYLDNIDKQIEKQKELREIAENKYNEQTKTNGEFDLRKSIIGDLASAAGYNLTFDNDRLISSNNIDAIQKAYLQAQKDGDTARIEELKYLLEMIEEHNDVILTSIEEHEQTLLDTMNAEVDLLIEKFNSKIEFKEKIAEALTELNEFKAKYLSGGSLFGDESGLGQYQSAVDSLGYKLGTVTVDSNNDTFEIDGGLLEDSLRELGNIGTTKNALAASPAAFEEYYTNLMEKTYESFDSIYEEAEKLFESYEAIQEDLMGLYDKQIERLSNINSLISGSAELWKFVGKNASDYSTKLEGYYSNIRENNQATYNLALEKIKTANEEYVKAIQGGDKSMIAIAEENLASAGQAITDTANEVLTAISDEFSNKLTLAIDNVVKEVSGLDLAGISEKWELETAADERYLDSVNSQYGIDTFNRAVQKSIDETDSIAGQRKLAEMRAEQEEKLNEILKERGKLSQYELDRANAVYDLTLKQIALEEAQRTASKLKLTRDASGNYSYQYVQDEDAIAKAEEELAAAENELYNLDKERTKTLVDEYYSTMTEANNAIAEAMAAGDQDRVNRLKEYYFSDNGLIGTLQKELSVASENLQAIGVEIEDANFAAPFKAFTDEIANMKLTGEDGLFNQIETLVNGFVGKDGILTTSVGAIQDLLNADGLMNGVVSNLNTTVETAQDFSDDVVELMDASQLVVDNINTLTPILTTLANKIQEYGQDYIAFLKAESDKLTDNQALTLAIDKLSSSVDSVNTSLQSGFNITLMNDGSGQAQVGTVDTSPNP